MKKIVAFVLIFGLIGVFVFPYFFSEETNDTPKLEFQCDENLIVTSGKIISIPFEIFDKVASVDLIINEEKLKTWKNPSGLIKFEFDTKDMSVGSYSLELVAVLADGSEFRDERFISILSDIIPEKWSLKIINEFPHEATSFTQGLAFDSGKLFEGTGDPNQTGATRIAELNLKSGQITRELALTSTYFGEGITIFGNELYQLTWQNQTCFVYDKTNFTSKKEFTYTGEGWGLCNDGKNLIMSDGSERIYFRDPKTFQVLKTIYVYSDQGSINRLNELEYIDGFIYANIWTSSSVAVIDPSTGKIIAFIDASEVVRKSGVKLESDVLNGIAYNSLDKKLYLTGKNWPKLYEVNIIRDN